jgi:hypothetical protein
VDTNTEGKAEVSAEPPDCPVACLDDDLAPNINHDLTINENIVITGDLNCDLLRSTGDGQRLVELCNNFN